LRVEWTPESDLGYGGLFAVPESYDASPIVAALLIDGCPTKVTAERLGVAATLAFGRYASGSLTLPAPVSPEVAEAVEDYCESWVAVGPLRLEPKPLPSGNTTFVLGGKSHNRVKNGWGRPREVALDVRRSDKWSGKLTAVDELIVASNAWLLGTASDPSDLGSYLGHLAVATLFAESLAVDTIALPAEVDISIGGWSRVQALLASARLGLIESSASDLKVPQRA